MHINTHNSHRLVELAKNGQLMLTMTMAVINFCSGEGGKEFEKEENDKQGAVGRGGGGASVTECYQQGFHDTNIGTGLVAASLSLPPHHNCGLCT